MTESPTATVAPAEYWLTSEVAQLLRVPEATCRYWRHVGEGPKSFKVGRRVLYDAAGVRAWLAEAQAAS